jgi:DNA-directed RNA polymerase specialized sigma24 family protein
MRVSRLSRGVSCLGSGSTTARVPEDLVAEVVLRVRRALVARYGLDLGAEAAAEAAAWAVQHRDRLAAMANPAGYLYRVGQSAARRLRRHNRGRVAFPVEQPDPEQPGLPGDVFAELARLRHEERVSVLLVHGYRFTYREVADLLGASEAAVTNYVHRGLTKLRRRLEGSR